MSTAAAARTAQTSTPILDVLAERWSPRAFEADAPIDETKLAAALEAARWAPSASNTQPWRFIVARRGSDLHADVQHALRGYNRDWAGTAQVLIVALATETDAEGKPLLWAEYDLGQAVAHLSVQAHADGLVVHQMGGFDREAIRALSGVPESCKPMTVIALGAPGDPTTLSQALQERERAPRVRRPLRESILAEA